MRVEQLMTKDVSSCDESDRLTEAATIMWERDCGAAPVVARAEGRVIGMITDRDVCMAAYTTGRPLAELRVRDAMSPKLLTCTPGDSVEHAEAVMRRFQVRRLPVVDDAGNLAGILSLADIARAPELQQTSSGEHKIAELVQAVSTPRS